MTFTLTCIAAELKAAIDTAVTVTSSGVKVPILKAVRIEVSKGKATVIATNTDHAIRAVLACEGKGIVHLDTAALHQKASALRQDQPVTITGDGKAVTVVQGRTRYKLPELNGDGFPFEFANPDTGTPVAVPRDQFISACTAAHRIVNPKDNRIIARGVYLDMRDGFHVIAAATQALTVIQIDAPPLPLSLILPSDAIRAIGSIFPDGGVLNVIANEQSMTVVGEFVTYKTKLVEGAYADWRVARDMQTRGLECGASVQSTELVAALNRATAIAEDIGKAGAMIAIRATIADGELTIKARNNAGEDGEDACAADGDPGTFGVTARNLQTAIDTLPSAGLRIEYIKDGDGPIRITAVPPGAMDNYRVLMPVRVA